MSRGTIAVINFENLKHNFHVLNKLAPGRLVLVVKADAYGHGLKQVVATLNQADCFGVATIEEALIVREVNAKVRILLLEGYLNEQQLIMASEYKIDCVIHQSQQLDMLDKLVLTRQINVWLKYDSGMNRLGFDHNEYADVIKRAEQHKEINEIILMSHLASADDNKSNFTRLQTDRFLTFADGKPLSLSNSSALLNHYHLADEWCRVGLVLFGVSPIIGQTAKYFGLKPVMTLKSNVIASKKVAVGQGIGYSQKYLAKKDMDIAIIGIGYGDGYPWALVKGAHVMLRGHRAEIVGRVSMDMIAVDISHVNDVQLGESVLVWGEENGMQLPVEKVAGYANTIAYVLLCQITSRVHYQYVY